MAANNFSYPYGRTGFRFSLEDASTCTESKLKTLDGNKPVVDVTLAALYIDQVTSRNLVYKSGDACDEDRPVELTLFLVRRGAASPSGPRGLERESGRAGVAHDTPPPERGARASDVLSL